MTARPNILFILSDQQRWDTCGCYGQPIHPRLTPHLDRLASQGTRFQYAFTPQPVCGPARSCLQSGLYATQTGCWINGRGLPVDQPTIAKLLSAAGYTTGYIGKWHLAGNGYERVPVPRARRGGYDEFWLASDVLEFTSRGYGGHLFDADNRRVNFKGYRVDKLTDFALDYLSQYAGRRESRPFFLFTSYIEPHHQNDLKRYVGPVGSRERFKRYAVPGDLVGVAGDWRKEMPDYLGCCWSLDQNVGRIVAKLDALGLSENTLFIYTSDHGCHFATRNSEYKRSAHDASIRVPLIVRGPGFTGGHVVEQLTSLLDLPPTILRAARVVVPRTFQGRPLQPLIRRRGRGWPKEVFVQVSEDHVGRAIRTKRWKYSVWVPSGRYFSGCQRSGSGRYVEQFLYDLEADPHERHNLIASPRHAAIRRRLAAALRRHMQAAGERIPVVSPADPQAGTPGRGTRWQ